MTTLPWLSIVYSCGSAIRAIWSFSSGVSSEISGLDGDGLKSGKSSVKLRLSDWIIRSITGKPKISDSNPSCGQNDEIRYSQETLAVFVKLAPMLVGQGAGDE